MKKYKAIVKERQTGERVIIEGEYASKQKFITELRSNGFMVNPDKIKESHVFDWIMQNTNCAPWDWKETGRERGD